MPTAKKQSAEGLPEDVGSTLEAKAESRAKVFGLYADTWARLFMVGVICAIFVWLNWSVMSFIKAVFAADLAECKINPNAQRIVDKHVLMTLIGATVVQVGVAITAIVSYLFPKKSRGKTSESRRT